MALKIDITLECYTLYLNNRVCSKWNVFINHFKVSMEEDEISQFKEWLFFGDKLAFH